LEEKNEKKKGEREQDGRLEEGRTKKIGGTAKGAKWREIGAVSGVWKGVRIEEVAWGTFGERKEKKELKDRYLKKLRERER